MYYKKQIESKSFRIQRGRTLATEISLGEEEHFYDIEWASPAALVQLVQPSTKETEVYRALCARCVNTRIAVQVNNLFAMVELM